MLRKKLTAVLAAGVIGMAMFGGSGSALAHEEHEAGQGAKKEEVCPVTGEKADPKGVSYEYKGKVYHFCCASCVADFKKDPEKYIKKMKEQEGAAKAKEHDHPHE